MWRRLAQSMNKSTLKENIAAEQGEQDQTLSSHRSEMNVKGTAIMRERGKA